MGKFFVYCVTKFGWLYITYLYMTKNDENFTEISNFLKIQRNAQIGLSDFEQKHKTNLNIVKLKGE